MSQNDRENHDPWATRTESRSCPLLVMVIPCFNEEPALHKTAGTLDDKLNDLIRHNAVSPKSRILFVDDGSTDSTWTIISNLHHMNPARYHGIRFSHNSGHQNAVYGGLMESLEFGCDVSISMDADLQDDPDAIDGMIEEFRTGSEIVFGVRNNRDTDTLFKRFTAESFYKMMTWMDTETIPNHADYRLMSREAILGLSEYKEENLFLRGIVPALGFTTGKVYYKRRARTAGESKYPLSKMLGLALEGITSFSVKPLRLITLTGFLSIIASFIMLIYTIISVASRHAVSGWGSMMFSLWLLGGLILTALGIVGEYIGRIYIEVKHRPRYIINAKL